MANLRNEFEFRSALLTALGQEHTEAEAKNEDTWRRKMLDGLGVEYNQNDVNQFGLFREKLIEGVTNYSGGGGGETWNTVFEGNVTTVEQEGGQTYGLIEGFEGTSSATIKVTFDGTEYTLGRDGNGGYGNNETPFYINNTTLHTRSAGTHTLKIEEPQSGGGSSDFSTAEVTVIGRGSETATKFSMPIVDNQREGIRIVDTVPATTKTYIVPLYKGKGCVKVTAGSITDITGEVTGGSGNLIIMGDCSFVAYYRQA